MSLLDDVVGDGSVDGRGRPSKKSTSGRWKAAYFIMGVQLAERTAYYGIVLNLVTYLVQDLHEGIEYSSTTVFNWAGAVWILPLLGGFLADAYIGRFYMIVVSIIIYILGLSVLVLSMSLDGLRPPPCPTLENCAPATTTQRSVFFLALYLVALGIGGISPCLSPFGADQFNEDDDNEKKMKRSFFNYNGIAVAGGGVIALSFIVYVQDQFSWGWGYAIPTFGMVFALVLILSGLPWYRHQSPKGSPLTEVAQVFTAAILNAKKRVPADPSMLYDIDVRGKHNVLHTNTLSFLDKAAVVDLEHEGPSAPSQVDPTDPEKSSVKENPWRLCSVTQVEEIKLLMRVMPIWIFSLMFMVHVTQLTSFFLLQSTSLDRSMGPHFKIPAASMTIFNSLTAIVSILLYDNYFVPFMRRFTGNERGISMLQRIGAGLAITTITMVVAAGTEIKRLDVIKEHGLQDNLLVPVPMSVFWLLPQYMLLGVAEILVMIGQLEFFYDQAPENMQSIGTALYTSNTAVAHFITTGIVKSVVRATGTGPGGWIVNNINQCHIDKYYLLLAVLGAVNFIFYVLVAKWYTYKKVERRL